MKISDIYGSKFIGVDEVKKAPLIAKITEVAAEEIKGKEGDVRQRIVLTLEDCPKRLILNATNAEALAEACGDDTDGWVDSWIEVGTHKVLFGGRKVDGLRVKPIADPHVK